MIILDTNVISEAMRGQQANAQVLVWLRTVRRPATTVLNRAEILAGIAMLPAGGRRDHLQRTARQAFAGLGVCLPLTPEGADQYADMVAVRRRAGRPIGGMDALIAAIALQARAQIATRDVPDFAGLGLTVVDPWQTG